MERITQDCDKHKTGDRVEVGFAFKAENGHTYQAVVTGRIVKRYPVHIGAGWHRYQILFDKPRWPDSDELLLDEMEYDLEFL